MELTNARRHGLTVLFRGHLDMRPVYESNITSPPDDPRRLTVYWQTVRWLVEHGYATIERTAANRVTLTAAGLDLARQATR